MSIARQLSSLDKITKVYNTDTQKDLEEGTANGNIEFQKIHSTKFKIRCKTQIQFCSSNIEIVHH